MVDAVVLGSGLNALGALRSLGGYGLRLALVSDQARGVAQFSRFATRRVRISDAEWQPTSIAERLELGQQRPMLFLTEEHQVITCLADVAAWQAVFHTYFFTPSVAGQMLSKTHFDRLARAGGAPVTRTVAFKNERDLERGTDLRFPLVIKPAMRQRLPQDGLERARKIHNEAEFHSILEKALKSGVEVVAQEWIEGKDSDIYFSFVFLDASGRLCSSFVGRKLLCWPPAVGGTASCVAAPEFHDQLTTMTVEFLARIGFQGLLGMEYKRDSRDGMFYMIEPTVYRTDYQHEVATLSGVDFLADVYRSCVDGQVGKQSGYQRRRRWVDFPAARYSAKATGLEAQTAKGLRRVDGHFRLTDPLPGLVHYARYLRTLVLGLLRRLRNEPGRGGRAR
jgi:D-aspartate ligase